MMIGLAVENALQILNQLKGEGILRDYAIGGAMGAMFYTEPVLTFDLDIFVILPQQEKLLSLSPLHEALKDKGYREDRKFVMIGGTAVQFYRRIMPWWRKHSKMPKI
jgi:hypothetical protein